MASLLAPAHGFAPDEISAVGAKAKNQIDNRHVGQKRRLALRILGIPIVNELQFNIPLRELGGIDVRGCGRA